MTKEIVIDSICKVRVDFWSILYDASLQIERTLWYRRSHIVREFLPYTNDYRLYERLHARNILKILMRLLNLPLFFDLVLCVLVVILLVVFFGVGCV